MLRSVAALSKSTARAGLPVLRTRALSTAATTKYRSTRGGQTGLKFDEAVLQGLGTDRGLLVPETIPSFPADWKTSWKGLSYEDLAFKVMSLYIGPDDIAEARLKDIIKRSYATFRDPALEPPKHSEAENGRVTPVREITDGMHVLELYHGPTFAFKDVALQFLGNLYEELLSHRPGMKITVVGATSGDTGSSAIHGLRGKPGIECFIMYPEGRTSRTQELQMISVTDPNIHNIALGGTFDDCQAVVKACFNDHAVRTMASLSQRPHSANGVWSLGRPAHRRCDHARFVVARRGQAGGEPLLASACSVASGCPLGYALGCACTLWMRLHAWLLGCAARSLDAVFPHAIPPFDSRSNSLPPPRHLSSPRRSTSQQSTRSTGLASSPSRSTTSTRTSRLARRTKSPFPSPLATLATSSQATMQRSWDCPSIR